MHFTIITPSFNQLDYLKRCVASVADQVTEGVKDYDLSVQEDLNPKTKNLNHRLIKPISIHHHIQDACSTDGTREFLRAFQIEVERLKLSGGYESDSFSFASEADEGMYDAINRGVELTRDRQRSEVGGQRSEDSGQRAEGRGKSSFPNNQQPITANSRDSVIAWLNCDEQYLPGTLQKVAAFFESHSDVDILFGGMLVVDEKGELLACRKAMPMRNRFLEASYLYNYSCAMFFRESLWRELGGFDTSFKNAGDEDLIRRAMKHGARSVVLNDYLSTFTYSDTNLSSDPAALEEHERLKQSASFSARVFKLPMNLLRLIEKFLRGGHVQRGSVAYEIFQGEAMTRTEFKSNPPGCRWPGEAKPYLVSHRLKKNG